MNKEQFLANLKMEYDGNIAISKQKNSDYASEDNPFKNFKMCEELGICSTEVGILTRMSDKMSRIAQLLNKKADVLDESIGDTLADLANYAMILKIYIDEKNGKN